MELENDDSRAADFDAMDRRVIQIDLPPAHAGITAALRQNSIADYGVMLVA